MTKEKDHAVKWAELFAKKLAEISEEIEKQDRERKKQKPKDDK